MLGTWRGDEVVGCKLRPTQLAQLLGDDNVVGDFIAYCWLAGYGFATTRGDVFALRALAVGPGVQPLRPVSPYISRLLNAVQKLSPSLAEHKRLHVSQALLCAMLKSSRNLATVTFETPGRGARHVMWHAVFAVAFAACLRVSEYTGEALLWSDVGSSAMQLDTVLAPVRAAAISGVEATFAAARAAVAAIQHGQLSLSLKLRKTKTSQAIPVTIRVHATGNAACPVVALLVHYAWLTVHNPRMARTHLPVFALGMGLSITPGAVTAKLRELAALGGASRGLCEGLSPHSLRSGGATAAALGGASEEAIKALGCWRSDSVRLYVRASTKRARVAQLAQHRSPQLVFID